MISQGLEWPSEEPWLNSHFSYGIRYHKLPSWICTWLALSQRKTFRMLKVKGNEQPQHTSITMKFLACFHCNKNRRLLHRCSLKVGEKEKRKIKYICGSALPRLHAHSRSYILVQINPCHSYPIYGSFRRREDIYGNWPWQLWSQPT